MNINEYFKSEQSQRFLGSRNLAKRITCEDGFSISVQANEYAYCSPRDNYGPYYQVELGYPSGVPNEEIMQHCEDPENPTGTVYSYVPVEIVDRLIAEHGGIKLA